MKKIKLKRACKILLLVLPLIIMTFAAEKFLFVNHDHNHQRLEDFYSMEENSLDVVFIGASEVFSGYAPGYAYGKYSYTSYMYAMESNQGSLYKAQLKEVLAHQDPQYIIIDVYGFLRAYDASLFEEARLRMFTESIPLSANKIDTIMNFPYENKISCFFPIIKYHGDPYLVKNQLSRYVKLISGYDPSLLKGMVTNTTVYSGAKGEENEGDNGSPEISPMCRQYLDELIDYCQQENLENIIFVNFPRYAENGENSSLLQRVEEVARIVQERGYPFLNLQNNEDTELDFSKDFRDSHHLNVYGQFKITGYFGKLLTETYGMIPQSQSKNSQVHWAACASAAAEYYAIADHAIINGINIYINDLSEEWIYRDVPK